MERSCGLRAFVALGMVVLILTSAYSSIAESTSVSDLGIIKLELHAATGKHFILSKKTEPMPHFSFEYEVLDGRYHDRLEKGTTNDQGQARIAIVPWKPGMKVAIYVPSRMEDLFQVKEVEKANPNPQLVIREEDYYRNQFYEGEGGYHELLRFWKKNEPDHYPSWDQMTVEDKKRFGEFFKYRFDALRKHAAMLTERAEHPNHLVVEPQDGPGQTVRLVYKPAPNELNLQVRFIDQRTRKPLANVVGFASETDLNSTIGNNTIGMGHPEDYPEKLRSCVSAANGEATISHILLSEKILESEKAYAKEGGKADLAHPPHLFLSARAPGYVNKMFFAPMALIRSGKRLILEMEPEARVRGRVVNAEGKPDSAFSFFVHMVNWKQNEKRSIVDPSYYPDYQSTRMGMDGSFELQGLRPCKGWRCEIKFGAGQSRVIRDIELKPGVNDLGDIRIFWRGMLESRVMDDRGQGLAEAEMRFMRRGCVDYETFKVEPQSYFHVDPKELSGERQWVRLLPPWSKYATMDRYYHYAPVDKTICFDSILDLGVSRSNMFNTRLERGNTLFVDVLPGKARDELLRFYSTSMNTTVQPDRQKNGAVRLAVGGAALQALAPNPEGFIYMQRTMSPEVIDASLDGKIRLRLENVPPGRHALRVDGYYYYVERRLEDSTYYKQIQNAGNATVPIAYTEFDMQPTTTTLQVAVNDAAVEMSLEGLPKREPDIDEMPMVLLLRATPLSLWHGEEYQRLIVEQHQVAPDSPEAFLTPMLGYHGWFGHIADDNWMNFLGYRPIRIQGVPPGTYRVVVYPRDIFRNYSMKKPLYETKIEVPREGGTVSVRIPFLKAGEYDVPKPKLK